MHAMHRFWWGIAAIGLSTLAALMPLAPLGQSRVSYAQTACSNSHTWGYTYSGTGSTNAGTQGEIQIPTSWSLDNAPYGPFLVQSGWISGSDTESGEAGIFYGFAKQTNS